MTNSRFKPLLTSRLTCRRKWLFEKIPAEAAIAVDRPQARDSNQINCESLNSRLREYMIWNAIIRRTPDHSRFQMIAPLADLGERVQPTKPLGYTQMIRLSSNHYRIYNRQN